MSSQTTFAKTMSCFIIYCAVHSQESSLKHVLGLSDITHCLYILKRFCHLTSKRVLRCFSQVHLFSDNFMKYVSIRFCFRNYSTVAEYLQGGSGM